MTKLEYIVADPETGNVIDTLTAREPVAIGDLIALPDTPGSDLAKAWRVKDKVVGHAGTAGWLFVTEAEPNDFVKIRQVRLPREE